METLAFPVENQELRGGDAVQRGGYQVRAVQVEHRVNALAYVLEEGVRAGKFNVERASELGVQPGPDFGRLQRGEPVTLPDGRTVRPEEVLGQPRGGRKLVISGDTRPCQALVEAAREADVLVHEATFSDDEKERALDTRHSTAREAGRVAREAQVRRLLLTHLSTRHDVDPSPLIQQAREEFQGAMEVAHDGMTFEIPLRE